MSNKFITLNCPYCQNPFEDFIDLVDHIDSQHKNSDCSRVLCPFCSWSHPFEDKIFFYSLLQSHLNKIHSRSNSFPLDLEAHLTILISYKNGVTKGNVREQKNEMFKFSIDRVEQRRNGVVGFTPFANKFFGDDHWISCKLFPSKPDGFKLSFNKIRGSMNCPIKNVQFTQSYLL